MLQRISDQNDLLAEQVAFEAELSRRQAQVLGSKGFAEGFTKALVAWRLGEKPTHSKDLKRKYAGS